MKIYGEKKYNIISADDPMLEGKTFESPSKTKFQKGIDVWFGDVLKISMPNGGVLTTRNSDHTFYNETFASGDVIYVAIGDGLDSIELPSGASAEIAKTATRNSGGSSAVGGVTSWNDLTDKPFGKTIVKILPETTMTFTDEGRGTVDTDFILEVGNTYTVNWNGVKYECVGIAWTSGGTEIGVAIGDTSNIGVSDVSTGEPFVIASVNTEIVEEMGTSSVFLSPDDLTEVTVSITGECIDKLDEEYLPDDIATPKMFDLTSIGVLTNTSSYTVGDGSTKDLRLYASANRKARIKFLYSPSGDTETGDTETYEADFDFQQVSWEGGEKISGHQIISPGTGAFLIITILLTVTDIADVMAVYVRSCSFDTTVVG